MAPAASIHNTKDGIHQYGTSISHGSIYYLAFAGLRGFN